MYDPEKDEKLKAFEDELKKPRTAAKIGVALVLVAACMLAVFVVVSTLSSLFNSLAETISRSF